VPVCPEVAIGRGTPREPIRLVGDTDAPKAVGTVRPELDVTEALAAYGRQIAEQLHDINGYILMQKSPSCGMERVKVYAANGHTQPGGGSGVFAQALIPILGVGSLVCMMATSSCTSWVSVQLVAIIIVVLYKSIQNVQLSA